LSRSSGGSMAGIPLCQEKLGSVKAARITLQPGWRWSECIKPVAGTESCQTHHVGAVASGQLQVRHDDGTEVQVGPGDAYVIEPSWTRRVLAAELSRIPSVRPRPMEPGTYAAHEPRTPPRSLATTQSAHPRFELNGRINTVPGVPLVGRSGYWPDRTARHRSPGSARRRGGRLHAQGLVQNGG
jgi:hypothetical protein